MCLKDEEKGRQKRIREKEGNHRNYRRDLLFKRQLALTRKNNYGVWSSIYILLMS